MCAAAGGAALSAAAGVDNNTGKHVLIVISINTMTSAQPHHYTVRLHLLLHDSLPTSQLGLIIVCSHAQLCQLCCFLPHRPLNGREHSFLPLPYSVSVLTPFVQQAHATR